MILSDSGHFFFGGHFNGFGRFSFRFRFRAHRVRVGCVLIAIQQTDWWQSVDAKVLIQQVTSADVVRAMRALVRSTSRTVKLSVVDVLTLVVTDVRASAAAESSSGARLLLNMLFHLTNANSFRKNFH